MKTLPIILMIILASCRIERKIYSPLPVTNPSLQEKNDYSVNASVSTPFGFDVNGGYAITNHFGIIAGGYTHKNKDEELHWGLFLPEGRDSSILTYRHNGFTLGLGYFFPLGGKESDIYVSFYGGINKGSFRMNEEFYEISPNPTARINFYKSRLDRWFLQGSLNHYTPKTEASLTARYNIAEYKNVSTDYTPDQLVNYHLPPAVSRKTSSFIDIGLDFKFYFSKDPRLGMLFYTLGSIRTTTAKSDDENNFYHYYRGRVGAGIFFRGFAGKK